jgi:2'-hydroxyisoflavone reductase
VIGPNGGGDPAGAEPPLLGPVTEDVDLAEHPDAYGGMKVACERIVLDGARSALVVRPGLVVGPGDPTGRFTYWPVRMHRGGRVLVPGEPDDPVQVVDVRDLAAWLVVAAESRTTGVLEAVGPVLGRKAFLAAVARGVEPLREPAPADGPAEPELVWAPEAWLREHEVEPWAGPGSLPLWLPADTHGGMMAHDPEPAAAAGLAVRRVEETARDTLEWYQRTPEAVLAGLSRDREDALLAALDGGVPPLR